MRKNIGIYEDIKSAHLRVRIPELREEGKRSPTYNLCTLNEYNFLPNGRERTQKQKDLYAQNKYLEVYKNKKEKFQKKPKSTTKLTEADKHTVSELIDRFEDEYLIHKSRSSQINISQQLIFWKKKFGTKRLSEMETKEGSLEILKARDSLKSSNRGNSTLNRYLAALSTVFGCAVKDLMWMDKNPCSRLRKKPEPKGRIRFLSKEEKTRLLSNCDQDLHDAIMISLLTGGRKNEIWSLRFDQINWNKNFITFIETKGDKPRSIPLGSIREILTRRTKNIQLKSAWVFPAKSLVKPTTFEKSWKTALRKSKIKDFTWHDLRHTFASYAVMNGVPLKTLSELMGHEDVKMTIKYAHLAVTHLEDAMKLVEEELGESKAKVKKLG